MNTILALKKRILEISYTHNLSHIGSCLSVLPIIAEIYAEKKQSEKFILSSGHAHLAHLVVMEALGQVNAEESVLATGIHCDRLAGCDVSTGSLGQGLPIAVGMAMADPKSRVYCIVSDGEMAEGSITEALRIANDLRLKNIQIYINANGWGAYRRTDLEQMRKFLLHFRELDIKMILTGDESIPFLKGQAGHYVTMSQEDYEQALEVLG